ncbi:PREDICTED: L-type lectin-domain containing receptor kinase IX.1-like isoform X2 [Ipomoea nil]|uniref:L-type lectin-domain containing receptor kinase IX.1-like isoform X2 n=1 Tax=Ipomoea nil TaxID=35883 RepID=UPI000901301F|nr:PREDICTED: L-type lectin-domain containing receptor kinase IX.1-like isoform X2 [Ipomoea nil]
MAAAFAALLCRFLDISPAFAFAFVFLVFPSLVCSLSFDLPSIGEDDNVSLKLDGDASITPQGIQLTPYYYDAYKLPVNNYKAGRAMYVESLHLWDNDSGDLADFTTRFTFNIDSNGTTPYADGIAFFLAKISKPLSSYPTYGNSLGLTQWKTEKAVDPFVAVVFDTYSINKPLTNVSININSTLESVNITAWLNNVTQGKDNNASITYNASSKILQVVFTGFWNGQYLTDSLSCKIDLRKHLPEFITIGFSAATGIYSERNTVKSWQFNSTSLRSGSEGKNKKKGVVIGLSIGVPILVALLALGVCTYLKKKMHADDEIIILGQAMDTEFQMASSGPKKFSYTELETATNNFAEEHKLGEGGFGGVYRGFLRSLNMDVAVKRVSSGSKQGIKEYASEVKIISRLRHRNLVPLHGWCHDKGELLLVYECMPEGSLDSHLFKGKSVLNWGLRYRIAQGLASALFYLHEEWEKCVLHRDIKSSNVLLDSSFNAKLGDFGLAWLVDHEKPSEKTLVGGTPGYVAPECHFTFKTSKESDVYSFGIVALEIATGQRAIIFVDETEGFKRLVEWVWDLYGMGKLMEAADPKLCGNFERQEMEQLMMIGLWCAHPDSNFRPKISQALHGLQLQVQVPTLPPEMPVYSTCYNVPSFTNLRSQIFEGYTSPSNNSYPSHVTSSSATDASHSHTH